MKRTLIVLFVAVAVCSLLLPGIASAYVPGVPSTAVGTSTAGRWANLRTTAFFSWPTYSTVKVTRVNVTATSTHYGYHCIDTCYVCVTSGTTNYYGATCLTNHYIWNMGSATCVHYPNKTLPALASNRVGTKMRYIGEYGVPLLQTIIDVPLYWTQNFGG